MDPKQKFNINVYYAKKKKKKMHQKKLKRRRQDSIIQLLTVRYFRRTLIQRAIKLYNKITNFRGVFRDLGPLLSLWNVKDICGVVLY